MKIFLLSYALIMAASSASATPGFPNPASAWPKDGVTISNVDAGVLRPGMTRFQVRQILGAPHFGEFIGRSRWNYVVNIADGPDSPLRRCQLTIMFESGRIKDLRWSDNGCVAPVRSVATNQALTAGSDAGRSAPEPFIATNNSIPLPIEAPTVTVHAPMPIREFTVNFALGMATLDARAQSILSQAAQYAAAKPMRKVFVIGGADSTGSDALNLALSLKRAANVASALERMGVSNIEPAGQGEQYPAIPRPDGYQEPANRRVVVRLIG